jgi:hypothetical protein
MGVVLQSLLIAIRPIDPIAFGTALLLLMAVLFAASGCAGTPRLTAQSDARPGSE